MRSFADWSNKWSNWQSLMPILSVKNNRFWSCLRNSNANRCTRWWGTCTIANSCFARMLSPSFKNSSKLLINIIRSADSTNKIWGSYWATCTNKKKKGRFITKWKIKWQCFTTICCSKETSRINSKLLRTWDWLTWRKMNCQCWMRLTTSTEGESTDSNLWWSDSLIASRGLWQLRIRLERWGSMLVDWPKRCIRSMKTCFRRQSIR